MKRVLLTDLIEMFKALPDPIKTVGYINYNIPANIIQEDGDDYNKVVSFKREKFFNCKSIDIDDFVRYWESEPLIIINNLEV